MNVALRANFEISVEKLNLDQFSKLEVYKRDNELNDLIIMFLGRNM